MITLLLIGLGPHAKRIYYPISLKEGESHGFQIVHAVDLAAKREDIQSYFLSTGYPRLEMTYLDDLDKCFGNLNSRVLALLDEIVAKHDIQGVIISTEPMAHVCYAKWALDRGLHVLMDKPVSVQPDLSSSMDSVEGLLKDYAMLEARYLEAKRKNPNLTFTLMAQRRFHPAFLKMKSLIKEVFEATNCPVTSVQSFHCDGQWRMPSEVVDQIYHPYCQGYGKCSHSGYHSIDMIPWLIEAVEKEKNINNVDVYSNFLYPYDFIYQMNLNDYRKLFDDFDDANRYSESELVKKYANYGEMDAFISMAFKHDDRTLTLGSTNLVHNGFAQRKWLTTEGRDLYKGNGRVRHESYFIEQGPFQAISMISYQSKEVDPSQREHIFDVGGEYHLDIHVFRNDKLFPRWANYEKMSIKDLAPRALEGLSRGHQEDARRNCILHFISLMRGDQHLPESDYLHHKRSTSLLYACYKSALLKKLGINPTVNIRF